MKKYTTILFLLFPFLLKAQIITTYAGSGPGPYSGDGGPATSAHIGILAGIAFDANGNLYIADGGNNRIRKVGVTSDTINTIAGTGVNGYNGDNILATTAELSIPVFVTLDVNNNVYIMDSGARVRKVDAATGIITTYAGNGTWGFSGDGHHADSAQINQAQGITTDKFGNLYILDLGNLRIRKVDTSGIITTIAGTGSNTSTGDGGLATAATVHGMLGICTDKMGNVYFTDGDASVRKINVSTGIITRFAGTGDNTSTPYLGDGLLATSSHIGAYGVAVDDTGSLFIADYDNERIEKVDTFGIIHTVAGTGILGYSGDNHSADSAQFNGPQGDALDPCGNLYIADAYNHRIRKIALNPTCAPLIADEIINPQELSVYPNPATTELTFAASYKINTIMLTNAVGQVLQRENPVTEKAAINIAHLPTGVYMVRITAATGNTVVKKFIKQ